MKRIIAVLLLYLGLASAALAQIVITTPLQGSVASILTPSATFTTSTSSVTLTGAANRWTYICGFIVTSAATATPVAVTVTVAGVPTTMNFTYTFVSTGQGILGIAFPGCITSSAPNTNIVVSVPGSGGTGTVGSVTAWEF